MPVLTISGQHSVGDKLPNALKNEVNSLKSVILKDSGHFVAEEVPEIFNLVVIQFLENTADYKHLSRTDMEKL